MSELSPYQHATKWYFIMMSAVIFFIGAYSLFMMRDNSFNAGWVFFIVLTILGLIGIIVGAGWIARKFRKELPESENKTGSQLAVMDKEIQRMQLRELPSFILMLIGIIGLMIMQHDSIRLLHLQIYASCILIGVGIIGVQAYKYELLVTSPRYTAGLFRRVWRGQTAKNYGIILTTACILGLIFFWIILSLHF